MSIARATKWSRTLAWGGVTAGAAFSARAEDAPAPVELHGSEVSIIRTAAAGDCPPPTVILDQVRDYLAESSAEPEGRVHVQASIDAKPGLVAEDTEYIALILVTGRRSGRRTLRARGPDCAELAEALAVSLALTLEGIGAERLEPLGDATPEGDPNPFAVPATDEPPAEGTPTRSRPRLPPPEPSPTSPPVHAWIAVGGVATFGVPADGSAAPTLGVGIEYGHVSAILGGFWAPQRTFDRGEGRVKVQLFGSTFHGCARFVGDSHRAGGHACAAVGLGLLRGRGEGYTGANSEAERLWRVAGGGVMARGRLTGPVRWGLGTSVLIPLWKEEFSVRGISGKAYSMPPASLMGGAEIAVRFR